MITTNHFWVDSSVLSDHTPLFPNPDSISAQPVANKAPKTRSRINFDRKKREDMNSIIIIVSPMIYLALIILHILHRYKGNVATIEMAVRVIC